MESLSASSPLTAITESAAVPHTDSQGAPGAGPRYTSETVVGIRHWTQTPAVISNQPPGSLSLHARTLRAPRLARSARRRRLAAILARFRCA